MHLHSDAFAALAWKSRQVCWAFQHASHMLRSCVPATAFEQQERLYLTLPQLKSAGLVGYSGVPSPINRVDENNHKPSFYVCQLADRIKGPRGTL